MKKILIVEDDVEVMEVYKFYLKMIGKFSISESYSEKETERYLNKKFDYAILDGLGGACFDLYPQIKADTKVIFTGDGEIYEKCKLKNIKSYLKPVKIKEFEEILK